MKTKLHPALSAPLIQSGDKTPTHAIRRRLFTLGLPGILFIALCTLSPFSTQAQCKQWDVTGRWTFQHSDGRKFVVDLQQHGTSFAGSLARADSINNRFAVSGNIQGTAFYMEGNFDGPSFYRGTVGPQGRIDGSMYSTFNNDKLTWFSTTAMKCADAAPVKPPAPPIEPAKPTPRPIKFTGRMPKATTPTPSAANPAAPGITASPANAAGGSTTLTWDGGPEHPYAEVWVAVDGEDPTFVVEQGKGSRRVTVEPGKTYRYILTDSGKDLSTVTVRGK